MPTSKRQTKLLSVLINYRLFKAAYFLTSALSVVAFSLVAG